MKDNLFEILMNFFTKSLSQLKEDASTSLTSDGPAESNVQDIASLGNKTVVIKSALYTATRVFTDEEKIKFTKASYQFLTQLMLLNIIDPDSLEVIISQLLFSESRFVNLQETKWTIRNTLAENLDAAQLAFLDLVLYQKEDKLTLH